MSARFQARTPRGKRSQLPRGLRLSPDRVRNGLRSVPERDFVGAWVYEVNSWPEENSWEGAGRIG
jgi:hypothetical protein